MILVRKIFVLVAMLFCISVNAQSLYSESTYKPIVSDVRSYKIGQVLTVLIYESATASSSTGTTTGRSLSVGVDATSNKGPGTPSGGYSADVGLNNNFDGSGSLTRSGKFVASVSVTITDITPSGELMIHGKQILKFNNEKQDIELEGKVRPEDVLSDNSVVSTRIADAKIKYMGEGLLSDRERPGIITKFFNWLF